MPTKLTWVVLAVAATTLAGCQGAAKDPAQQAAPPAASSAPAGNGVAALTADEILQRSTDALKKAKSFRAKGATVEDGQRTDVDLKVNGDEFLGSMAFNKAKVELLEVDGKKYLRPNEQFWVVSTGAKQGKQLAQVIGKRWVAGADSDKSFAELFTVGSVDELLKPSGAPVKGVEKPIGGIPAIGLKDAGDPDSTLWVATTGEPYPLQLDGKGGSALKFSAFGDTFADIVKPASGQIVDLGKAAAK